MPNHISLKTCSSCSLKHYARGFCKEHYFASKSVRAEKREYMQKYVRPESTKAYQKTYHADPVNKRKHYNRVLLKKYGWTIEEWESVLASQGGGCAICRCTPEQQTKMFAVDHNHETGKNRGILCGRCNVALGLLGDSADVIDAAAAYLRKHL